MNKMDMLNDVLEDEMTAQETYNKHMMRILDPEVRQLFTQLRDAKMQHVTHLQREIKQMMQRGKV